MLLSFRQRYLLLGHQPVAGHVFFALVFRRMNHVPPAIEPVVVDFIGREFADAVDADSEASRLEEIHHALFVEGKSVDEVHARLTRESLENAGGPTETAELLSIDLRFCCATCDQRLQVDGRSEGALIDCPGCAAPIAVPRLARALQLLSAAAALESERVAFQQMERGLMAVLGPAPESLAIQRRERTTSSVLSVEMRMRCGACRKSAQLDARFHGTSVQCPACAQMMNVPEWCDALRALHGSEFAVRPLRALSPLTAQEREFLSAPRSVPKKWWSGLAAPFRAGHER